VAESITAGLRDEEVAMLEEGKAIFRRVASLYHINVAVVEKPVNHTVSNK